VTVSVWVLVFVAVEVCVEVWVDVDVWVEVCVLVDVSVLVEVSVEDVRVGRVRVALAVGPEVRDGTSIVRDALGRLLPPPHAASSTAAITRINHKE
jgi:hypothetical protein